MVLRLSSMGGFRDAVDRDAKDREPHETRCKAVKVADFMDDEDRKLYLSLLERPATEIGHVWLLRRLAEAELPKLSMSSVRRHRQGKCLCFDFHYRHTEITPKQATDG